MSDDKQRIVEIEGRLGAVTPGEWWLWEQGTGNLAVHVTTSEGYVPIATIENGITDAEFIEHAPADMRWLLERVKVLEADNERLRVANLDLLSLRHGSIDARRVKVNEAIGQDGE